ncbi:GMC oxidoreductase [Macrolepiota fuliginosa MF-IS2]|uniref:pyranose dehydrogenase (acceptor) n=1 Tax=Macrolepiota fuliginosa MF-IS2 TaxID=1400762 RepID=A0A9P6C2R0_9AGAR|nr:GMC oxidoreductase [Macrolepiota fuliginosa MF-IS2]
MMNIAAFDYVIVGGGTAGLVVAARLTEAEDVNVCVLEAGEDVSDRKEVLVPGLAPEIWGKETNWGFTSVPQKHGGGKVQYMTRGKGLGGSSMANLMQLNRAPAHEYDALEVIGNRAWNSSEFRKYFVKSQTLAFSQDDINSLRLEPNENEFGSGPIFSTLSRHKTAYDTHWLKAFQENGVPYNTNAMGGEAIGTWLGSLSIHPETATRISSATAYYEPNKQRKNLTVITGAYVARIRLSTATGGEPLAEGVEYEKDGQKFSVLARKEVVLAAGTFQTPQILELSGIGRRSLLDQHNIPLVVDLPGVGENYQEDHPAILTVYELKPNHESFDALRINPNRAAEEEAKFNERREGMLTSFPGLYAFLPLEKLGGAQTLRDYAAQKKWDKIPESILKVQQKWLSDEKSPQVEFIILPMFWPSVPKPEMDPGKQYISVVAVALHPFSRGTVHINSSDPRKQPEIDPAILDNDFDCDVLVESVRFIHKVITETEAFKDVVEKEVAPGAYGDTRENLVNFLRTGVTTAFHPVGTASMMRREEGGVVDERLRVYGVKRLRVVDASILPIEIGAHTQATVYALAEKVTNLIPNATRMSAHLFVN